MVKYMHVLLLYYMHVQSLKYMHALWPKYMHVLWRKCARCFNDQQMQLARWPRDVLSYVNVSHGMVHTIIMNPIVWGNTFR